MRRRFLHTLAAAAFGLAVSAWADTTPVNLELSGRAAATRTDTIHAIAGSGSGVFVPYGHVTGGFVASSDHAAANPVANGNATLLLDNGDVLELKFSSPDTGALQVVVTATVTGGSGVFAGASGQITVTWIGVPVSPDAGTFTVAGSGSLTNVRLPTGPVAGSGNLGNPQVSGSLSCGQPVTVTNGNMYHAFRDFLIPSRGFPIQLQRTYNSQQSGDSPFGLGWTHNYRRYLTEMTNTVLYHDEMGGVFQFPSSGGGYVGAPGLDMTLRKDSSGFLLRRRNGTVMRFDSTGRLTSITDRNSNQQTFIYSGGNLASVADAAGGKLQFQYGAGNHVSSVTDQLGRTYRYEYDAAGYLTAAVDAVGTRTSYTYTSDGAHLLKTITFPDGGVTTYDYDSAKRVIHTTDAENGELRFSYGSGTTTVTDERGFNTKYDYNSAGNLTKITRPDGSTVEQTWDGNSKVIALKDANKFASSYTYDGSGRLLSVTDALGGITKYTYETTYNQITSVTDPRGNVTKMEYDSRGNLSKVTDPSGAQTSFTYDAAGQLSGITDGEGVARRQTFDSKGALIEMRDGAGNTFHGTYDARERLISHTDPLNHETRYEYDGSDRVVKSMAADGAVTRYAYDSAGRVIQTIRPDGKGSVFSYDKLGNLLAVTDALGNQTRYEYQAAPGGGTVKAKTSKVTDALGRARTFTYGYNDRITGATDPLGNTLAWSYDGRGDLAGQTDENGQATKLEYDALRRLVRATFADGSSQTYTYDGNGNLLTAANENVTLTFTYDSRNRRTGATDARFKQTILYTYDKAGRLRTMTDPSGGVTTYTRDAAGRLTQIAAPNGDVFQMQYDTLERRSAITLPNGITGQYTYDAVGRLTGLVYNGRTGGAVAQAQYAYDALGNRTSMTDLTGAHQYQYDPLNRLISAVHPVGSSERYTYDAVGNRSGVDGSITVDNNDRLLSADGVKFDYDRHGNTLSRNGAQGAVSYRYDAQNRLIGVTLADGTVITYKYDALGRRIEKNVGGKVTGYLYDGMHLLWEMDVTGQPVASYVHGPGIDQAMSMTRGGQRYYYLVDGLGSVNGLTDPSGVIIQSYTYSSFGRLTLTAANGTAIPNPFTFTGREWDAETGLYYYRARYYDPAIGRFLGKDPLWIPYAAVASRRSGLAAAALRNRMTTPQSDHPYAYAANNPINRIDPMGLDDTTSNSDAGGPINEWATCNADNTTPVPNQTRDLQVTPTPSSTNTPPSDTEVSYQPFVGIRQYVVHTSTGDVTFNVPDDMSAGDLISGQTLTLPGGPDPFIQSQASAELGGWQYSYKVNDYNNSLFSGGQPWQPHVDPVLTSGNSVVTLQGDPEPAGGTVPAETSGANAPAGSGTLGNPSSTGGMTVGDPVTVTNGNVYFPVLDIMAPSRGFPIALQRAYNSQQTTDSPFGIGWTHSYRRYLSQSGTGLIYHDESGGAYLFAAAGDGYVQAPGLNMTLKKDAFGYLVRRRNGGEMRFDAGGRLLTITDRNSNQQSLTYTGNNLAAVSDSIGGRLQFQYDALNHITAIQDHTGRALRYEYDAGGYLAASVDAAGARTTYAWYTDTTHLLKTITFADGGTSTYEYDASRRAIHSVDAEKGEMRFAYAAGTTTVTDERGFNTRYDYNPSGNLTRVLQPDGSTVEQTWNSDAKVIARKDANGLVTVYTYDRNGNLLTVTDALGGVRSYTYEPAYNQVASATDANGNVTSLQYDARGNLVKSTDASGAQTSFAYDAAGDLLSMTDAEGVTRRLAYDAAGTPIEFRDGNNNATRTTYDARKRLASLIDPLNHETRWDYNSGDRVSRVSAADGTATAYGYDPVGRLVQLTRPDGAAAAFSYDKLGNLSSVTEPLGNQTTYGYKPGSGSIEEKLGRVTDALGRTTAFTYGSDGRVTAATDPLGNTVAWAYDGRGDIVNKTDENGNTTRYEYDALRRLVRVSFADGAEQSFAYDANGNMLTAANENVTLTFTYDARNLLTSVTDSRLGQTVQYTYDRAGRLSTMIDPAGGVTGYARGFAGELARITGPNGEVFRIEYDANLRRSAIVLPNGITGRYSYDAVGRIVDLTYTNASGATVTRHQYTYDALGNRTSATDASGAHQYQHDALGRLTSAADPAGTVESFDYDTVGNRTAGTVDQGDRLLHAGTSDFTYDKNGNTLSRSDSQQGAVNYQYDAQNRLTSVKLADGSTVTYKYDALGRRIEKNAGGKITAYLSDGIHVLWEEDANGQPIARYLHGPGLDQQLEMVRAGQSYFYLLDSLGSVSGLTDAAGSLVQTYAYTSFGRPAVTAAGNAAVANPFAFTGREWDAETGLYYYRARYYDPSTGRFLTRDPLSISYAMAAARRKGVALAVLQNSLISPQFAHAYAYAENNPVNKTDPTGLTSSPVLTQPSDSRDLQVSHTQTNSTDTVSYQPFVGLVTVTFYTNNGEVRVNLPSDMSAGDLISGQTITLEDPAKVWVYPSDSLILAIYGINIDRSVVGSGGKEFHWNVSPTLTGGNSVVTLTGK